MGGLSPWHWLILLLVFDIIVGALVGFGARRGKS
jgi:Sec-independent protein translocase protein TatA